MDKDSIVEEVRTAGISIFEDLGDDQEKIANKLIELTKKYELSGWKSVSVVVNKADEAAI